jgi:hypothetical protein
MSKSDYLENKYIDWFFRGQAFTPPAVIYVGLFTTTSTDASPGTEVSGGNYARVGVSSSLTNWCGTHATGSTVASTGTGGTTSNNVALTFPVPSGDWGQITHFGLFDASTNGNMLYQNALTLPKTVNNGDPAPSFTTGSLRITVS